jgi:histidinol dehydrogenase
MKRYTDPSPDTWETILERPAQSDADIEAVVRGILDDVAREGDAAVRRYEQRFGHLGDGAIRVPEADISAAEALLEPGLRDAIATALANITRFHEAQVERHPVVETMPGVRCWRRNIPIQRVGLYIPGGTAPLFSSLLMLGTPARIAGCPEIVVCTPAGKDGKVHPAVLYCAQLLGITAVYRIGGAQAIAAMAFGTATVPRVDKILGPGNRYVDLAKRLVAQRGTAIDLPAGPSEVAVLADATSDPSFAAADLLSQAEHGADSQVLLVSTDAAFTEAVERELERQLVLLPREEVARQAMANSISVVMPDARSALRLIDAYAPEHLILACADAHTLAEEVVHAGSVFIGPYSCESAGDYASGTNHTLPTNGYARVSAGVSVDSFVRKTTFQELSREGLHNIASTIVAMAEAEGLRAHANAVRIRTGEAFPENASA